MWVKIQYTDLIWEFVATRETHDVTHIHYPPPKINITNIAPENGWLGDYIHFGKAFFGGGYTLLLNHHESHPSRLLIPFDGIVFFVPCRVNTTYLEPCGMTRVLTGLSDLLAFFWRG